MPLIINFDQRLWSYDHMALYKCVYYYYIIIIIVERPPDGPLRGSVFRRMKLGSKSSHSVCCKTSINWQDITGNWRSLIKPQSTMKRNFWPWLDKWPPQSAAADSSRLTQDISNCFRTLAMTIRLVLLQTVYNLDLQRLGGRQCVWSSAGGVGNFKGHRTASCQTRVVTRQMTVVEIIADLRCLSNSGRRVMCVVNAVCAIMTSLK